MDGIFLRPRAFQDLEEQVDYFSAEDPDLAERFLKDVGRAFEYLLGRPGAGPRCPFKVPSLAGLEVRRWPLHRFRKWWVYYHEVPEGIEVLRILHSARDLPAALEEA